MPCKSDHMEPNKEETALSKVLAFLDEIKTGKLSPSAFAGGHRGAYNKASKEKMDKKTAELCGILKETDVTKYSLEMQMWWRDHQKFDKQRKASERKRKASERKEVKHEAARKEALAKLSDKDKEALGLC